MDDDMDPEMAAALAASMMDVGDGGGGAAAGGGGSSGDFGFAPMMTDSDNTAALEVRLPLGPQERKHALHSPVSDAHFTCAGARGREGSNRCGRASAAGSMQGNVREQAVARDDKPFGQRVRLSRVGGERRHPHCARDPVSSTACVRCSSHNQGGHNRAKFCILSLCVHLSPGVARRYKGFVANVWDKLNRKRLARLQVKTSDCIVAVEERFAFLEDSCSKMLTERSPDEEAVLTLRCAMASILLGRGELKETKRVLQECEGKLDNMTGCENTTYASYYWAWATYQKATGDAEAYFKASLQFLGYGECALHLTVSNPAHSCPDFRCTPVAADIEELGAETRSAIAFEVAKAALLGDTIFNFGELLVHPIMATLSAGVNGWMTSLLSAFNSGDVTAYREVTASNAAAMQGQPELVAGKAKLEQKISLLALMQLVFKRAGDDRILSFADVSEATAGAVDVDNVEFLVMKACCLGVIDAQIDQVLDSPFPSRTTTPVVAAGSVAACVY